MRDAVVKVAELWRSARMVTAATGDRLGATSLERRGLAWRSPEHVPIGDAIERGVEFLVSRQRADGSLRGFHLTPGASVEWITAHTALVTADIPDLASLRARAAVHLAEVGPLDGGWGYNRRVGRDVDSTVQALMVIEAEGLSIPGFLAAWVRAAQRPDGAFATYLTDDAAARSGWHAPHPDVTAMVAWYFDRVGDNDRRDRCLRWLDDLAPPYQRASYWWAGRSYGLWIDSRISPHPPPAARIEDEMEAGHGVPHLALVVSAGAASMSADGRRAAITRLVAQQLDDGSWACEPCLRVTHRSVHTAMPAAAGTVSGDPHRVFSTAHAIAALHAFVTYGDAGDDQGDRDLRRGASPGSGSVWTLEASPNTSE